MNPSYKIGWHFFRGLFRFYFGWRVFNAERVPESGPVILACNHASYIDPPLAGAGLNRPISYLARASLFRVPILAAILRSWEVVAVDRDGGTGGGFKAILERLEGGGAILLFPEGTRTPDGQLQPARAGLGLAVIKSTAPVVPVRLFGTYQAYGRRQCWPRPRRRLTVKYGRPMDFAARRAEARACAKPRVKAIYQEVAEEIMAAIAKLEPKED